MMELGSDASAASGGYSELSAWQRSARREPAPTGEADAGHRNRKTYWIFFLSFGILPGEYADMMELVDV